MTSRQIAVSDMPNLTSTGLGSGFWSDVDGSSSIWRFTQRLFIGGAVSQNSTRVGAQPAPGFIANANIGANWAVRDSQFAVMQTRGGIAISGLSRNSDGDGIAGGHPATIGVAGYAIADTNSSSSSWAFYGDLQFQPTTASFYGYGMEMAVKNKSENKETTPDFATSGTFGFWINTGDDSYGGAHTNPNNTAILIGRGVNGNTWNRGLTFLNDGLTQDGFGRGRAISLGKKHHISWYDGSNHEAFYITSNVDTAGDGMSMFVSDNLVTYQNQNGDPVARLLNADFVTANCVTFTNSIAGSPVLVTTFGSDTDIGIKIAPKGAGVVTLASALSLPAVTFANRPATPVEGMLCAFTDSTTATWRATITGVGANHVLGYYNGTNWTVAA